MLTTDLKTRSVVEIEIPKNRNCQVEYYYNYWLVPKNIERHFHFWLKDLSTKHSTG